MRARRRICSAESSSSVADTRSWNRLKSRTAVNAASSASAERAIGIGLPDSSSAPTVVTMGRRQLPAKTIVRQRR
jgi:hypothetical protein